MIVKTILMAIKTVVNRKNWLKKLTTTMIREDSMTHDSMTRKIFQGTHSRVQKEIELQARTAIKRVQKTIQRKVA